MAFAFIPLEAIRTLQTRSCASGVAVRRNWRGALCYGVLSLERPVMGWRCACRVIEEGVGGAGLREVHGDAGTTKAAAQH